ncbi:hypothetical protein [Microbacterium trichothecenolyticum]|uniref:Type VII secretion integral membrane protein EccD n=1 Tax=Microbacterium trichothecenolyticum TaxID=69370 RepID=A0ABU0TV87_MICTR|nr:hypothetical protein [Microbacterium trichothecenolyticum]MDQ1123578.1 hypothetical protein [Microbacterium trichothecenolyticum]
MSAEVVHGRRVALVDGASRYDLVVPLHASVDDVLRAAAVSPDGIRIVGVAGREIDRATTMRSLDDGVVLVLVDPSASSGAAAEPPESPNVARRVPAAWAALAVGGGILALLRLLGGDALTAPVRVPVAFIALAAALASAAVFSVAVRDRTATLVPVACLVALAFGGGAALVPDLPASSALVAVFTGLLSGSVVAGVTGVLGATAALRAQGRTAAIVAAVLAAIWGLGLLLHLDATAPAAVTLGIVPIAQRVLQASLVDVAPGTFVDYARFQTTRWTVRQSLPDEVRTIDAADADALVERSAARLTVGVVMLVTAGAASAFTALPSFPGDDPVILGGRIALASTVVLSLLLGSRKSTVPFLRWVERSGAAVVVAAVLVALLPAVTSGLLVIVAGVCLAVGLGCALLTVPIGRGFRSLGWSRTGDVIEALATALSLPAGMLAAGGVEIARAMMAT